MTLTLIYLGLLIFALVCGIAIGATIVRDWLDGLWFAPRRKTRPTIPLARALHDAQWRRLELPAIKRRQRMQVIDV